MKKAISISFEKLAGLVIAIIVLAILLLYIFGEGGPKDMILSVLGFLNSSSNLVSNS